jgi:Zn-dependent peptidase ImmA (M78 family)
MVKLNRIIKRKKLVRKLAKKIIAKYADNIRLKIIDCDNTQVEYPGTSFAKHNDNFTKHIIGINILSLAHRVKYGYSGLGEYYQGRGDKLSFVKGNRKLALRFVILHELGHCLFKRSKNLKTRECNADDFAINTLTQEGLLKC